MKLGKHQLRLLASMASPFTLLIVGDPVAMSLKRRGLVEPRAHPKKAGDDGAFFAITPIGLRVLADAHERGELEQFLDPRSVGDRLRIMMDARPPNTPERPDGH